MSPLINSRHAARPGPSLHRTGTAFSPWHYAAFGLLALLGTGILAAIDRSGERATASQAEFSQMQRKNTPQTAPAPVSVQAAVVESPRAPVPAALPALPATALAAPAVRTGGEIASPAPRPVEPPAAATAFAPAPPRLVEAPPTQRPQPADGPAVTASLVQPAPPARPPVVAAPPDAARSSLKTSASASTDCLPPALRAVLADVAARFGEVTVVSTHQLNTVNHSAGSIREKLHHDCKAVDIRPDRNRIDEVKAYLRARPEIGGVESYRNGVVHMDVAGTAAARAWPGRPQAPAQDAPADVLRAAPAAPQETQATSLFAPVVNERYR